jgi:hypothetical protein
MRSVYLKIRPFRPGPSHAAFRSMPACSVSAQNRLARADEVAASVHALCPRGLAMRGCAISFWTRESAAATDIGLRFS